MKKGLRCEKCKNITIFHIKKKDAYLIAGVGGEQFVMRLNDKEYICEGCGSELQI